MVAVPTKTGAPLAVISRISRMMPLYLPNLVKKIWSFKSKRAIGLCVGMMTTSRLYVDLNSTASVSAVPVMPDNLSYKRK